MGKKTAQEGEKAVKDGRMPEMEKYKEAPCWTETRQVNSSAERGWCAHKEPRRS